MFIYGICWVHFQGQMLTALALHCVPLPCLAISYMGSTQCFCRAPATCNNSSHRACKPVSCVCFPGRATGRPKISWPNGKWCGAGGWFSLMMAAIYAAIMMLWQWGSTRKHAYFDSQSVPLDSFLRMSDAVRAA